MNKKEDSVQALAVGASVERKSGESEQVAFESESEQIAATKNDIGALSASLKETENTLEVSATKIPESSLSSSETEKKDVAAIQNGGIFSIVSQAVPKHQKMRNQMQHHQKKTKAVRRKF